MFSTHQYLLNMSWWEHIFVLLLCLGQKTEVSLAFRTFVYQKDMSEYCRRRVIPSVFLGRQVVDDNSEILHFSRIELPYSCFINVRTESGSNIILVIQLTSEKSLMQSCKENANQLIVYEIGETFGGYWGPLPNHLLKTEPTEKVNFYTMKTTQSPATTTEVSPEEETDVKELVSEQQATQWTESKDSDYITMVLPIVNVSAQLVPGQIQPDPVFNIDETFDISYDVTPGDGVHYETSVLPLVQFSIDNIVDTKRRGGGVEWSSRYGVDYNEDFTPDPRLMMPLHEFTTHKRKKLRYNKYNANRRLNFKQRKQFFAAKETPSYKKLHTGYTIDPYNILTSHYKYVEPPKLEKKVESIPNSWEIIEDILRNLSKTNIGTERPVKHSSAHLYSIPDKVYTSVYLASNLSKHKKESISNPQTNITRYTFGPITWRLPSESHESKILDPLAATKRDNVLPINTTESRPELNTKSLKEAGVEPQEILLDVDSIILKAANVTNIPITSNKLINSSTEASKTNSLSSVKLLTGSLVDHESWENIVQAAPVMAVILNQSIPLNKTTEQFQETSIDRSSSRKKRYINAVPIEYARPHMIPTVKEIFTSTTPSFIISDVQEFAELVELQDDEMRGRAALRYIRQYIGPALFNICDYSDAVARHVYLFNTSKLVLSLNNFTMDRMTVVVTSARTLRSSDARCTNAQLECQIAGARVCIDSLSACDGIPNCGSYDIYDEDRLMCGAAAGLLHNVYLAAFTFLAVLLTILYTVHYWLKRCVPKVSDAFFIYTDAAENVLYLDSIMRPAHGGDEGKVYYRSHIFQDEVQSPQMNQRGKYLIKRFLKNIFNYILCKDRKAVSSEHAMEEFAQPQRIYSFAENEIEKMIQKKWTEASVQTGSSLEIKVSREKSTYQFPLDFRSVNEKPGTSKDIFGSIDYVPSPESLSFEKNYDELSMLNFFRQARTDSLRSKDSSEVYKVPLRSKKVPQIHEEEELQYLDVGRLERSSLSPSVEIGITTSEIHTDKAELPHARKRLRFYEETTTIPSGTGHDADGVNYETNDNPRQRSIMLLAAGRVRRSQDLDSIEEYEEQGGSREHKTYFWGGNKSKTKKVKKKSQVCLR